MDARVDSSDNIGLTLVLSILKTDSDVWKQVESHAAHTSHQVQIGLSWYTVEQHRKTSNSDLDPCFSEG